MIDAGLVKPNLGMVARFALRGIPSVFGTQKEDQIRLSLSIQDGYLYVGRIRLNQITRGNLELIAFIRNFLVASAGYADRPR